MAGLVCGICRMGVHFSYSAPECGGGSRDERPSVFTRVHYLHFAIILASVTSIVAIIVSFVTAPRNINQVGQYQFYEPVFFVAIQLEKMKAN